MMARKRMIDPSIWQDEGMAELTPRQQLLYVGLFSNADDEGRLKGSDAALRLILPTVYAGVGLGEIGADVCAVLASFTQLVRYEVGGRVYLAFRNYRQWQKIDKPSASTLPPPPDPGDDTPTIRRGFDEDSTSDRGAFAPNRREVKLTEEKGTETHSARAPAREETPAAPPDGGVRVRAVPKPSTLSPEEKRAFERWYQGYPNKQHRPEAERAWAKLRPDAALAAALERDVGARRQGRKWSEGYVEQPATYLNNRVWEDDIEPVRLGPARAGPGGGRLSREEHNDRAFREAFGDESADVPAVIEAAFRCHE